MTAAELAALLNGREYRGEFEAFYAPGGILAEASGDVPPNAKSTIPMQPVKSSAIVALGHQGDTLVVEYKGGRKYRYPGINAEQFQKLKGAESIGSYLNQHIAPHSKGVKMDPDE